MSKDEFIQIIEDFNSKATKYDEEGYPEVPDVFKIAVEVEEDLDASPYPYHYVSVLNYGHAEAFDYVTGGCQDEYLIECICPAGLKEGIYVFEVTYHWSRDYWTGEYDSWFEVRSEKRVI